MIIIIYFYVYKNPSMSGMQKFFLNVETLCFTYVQSGNLNYFIRSCKYFDCHFCKLQKLSQRDNWILECANKMYWCKIDFFSLIVQNVTSVLRIFCIYSFTLMKDYSVHEKIRTLYTTSNSHWHTKLVDLQDVHNVLGVFRTIRNCKKGLRLLISNYDLFNLFDITT